MEWKRIAAGDYESADGTIRLYRLPDVSPPAWNVEDISNPYCERVLVDGAATKRDAIALVMDSTERSEGMSEGATTAILYEVVDNEWNRANYPTLIGQVSDEAPSYAAVKRIHVPIPYLEGSDVMGATTTYIVQVWNGSAWRKVRGPEGGPWRTLDRAERIAASREQADRRTSSTEGMPHRAVARLVLPT